MLFSPGNTTLLFLFFFTFLCSTIEAQVFLDENQLAEKHFPFNKVDHSNTGWWLEKESLAANILLAERQFNDYFTAHPQEKSLQKKHFIRWLQEARLSTNALGQYIPHQATVSKPKVNSNITRTPTGSWQAIGPNYAEPTTCGTTSSLTGGFCDRVYINPYNTENLLAGYSYGGLWVSQDQGQSWCLTDAAFANGTNTYANRDHYYGDIEASGLNPQLIFAATEAGLLKSSNGGLDWSLAPQLNRNDNPNTRPYYLALSTANVNIVLATFGRQLYRSTDGGNNWSVAFDNDDGGPNHTYTNQYTNNSTFGIYQRTYNFFGLEADHDDPAVFYLGLFNANNQPCIYKSVDNGASFSFLVNLNTATGLNLPANLHFRTIPAQADKFYIYSHFAEGNMYHFDEDGSLSSQNPVASYVEAGDINWLDENSVYVGLYGASSIFKSTDRGASFTDMTSGYGGCPKYVHPDVRDIDVVGDIVLIGSDGGLALSTDAMENVYSVGREISSIDLWGFSSSPHSDIIAAGCDHGPTKIRRFAGNNGWISRGGGDAGQVSVNQSNDHWIYFDHGYGIFKTELSEDYTSFLSTEAIDPDISLHRVTFHPNFYQTAYGISGTRVEVTRNNFSSFSTLYDFGQTVNRMVLAPTDTAIMYVLLSNNRIQKSIDGGLSWSIITPPAGISNGQSNISDIAVGDDPNHLWAAYANWQNDAKILQTTDGGTNWTNITSDNLPLTPVSQIVYQRGTDGGIYLAFAGQDGVYYRNNSMPAFEALGEGLPMLGYIRNIYTVPAKGKYRMGSSRGAWEHTLYEESTIPLADFAVSSNKSKCALTPIKFFQNTVHSSGPTTYEWTFEGGTPATSTVPNPEVTYTAVGEYDVSLTITDAAGQSHTKTHTNFIQVLPSICAGEELPGKMIDLAEGQTNRPALATIPLTGAEFTITSWVKVSDLQNSFAQIVSTNAPNTRFGLGFAFMGYTANTNLIFTAPDEVYWVESDINLQLNEWHYIAITYAPNQVRIYLDGQEPWVRNGTFQPIDFSQSPFYINNDIHNQGGNFHGQIDELAFYDYALTQEEIREKRHLVKHPLTEAGLAAYYQFNQYDATESALYEIVNGQRSTIIPSLIDNNSPIPVAAGAVDRIENVSTGTYTFSNTGTQLTFPSELTAPNGEIVVTRLDSSPNLLPNNDLITSNSYWIINNYGNNTTGLEVNLDLTIPGFVSSENLANYTLHQRPANATDEWTAIGTANMLDVASDEFSFEELDNLAQLIVTDAMLTATDAPEDNEGVHFEVSPNPATDQIILAFNSDVQGSYQVRLQDVSGQQLQSYLIDLAKIRSKTLNIGHLPAGVYIVSVQHTASSKAVNVRVVKL